jgi:uncharacterized protein involved in cysteine biosynthesis
MKQNKNNQSTKPLYVRVICWILIILMISSAIYYTIWGIQALFSSLFAGNSAETKTAALPRDPIAVTVLSDTESLTL